MQATSQEQRIPDKVIVEVVINELPQLAGYVRGRRCHDADQTETVEM
jgi:hypothetical protein